MAAAKKLIFTVGHSTRSIEEFLELLQEHQVTHLADVRRFPGSRRHPHFGQDALREALAERQIAYSHFVALGGRRGKREADSPNTGWRVEQFGAYADFMASDEFSEGLDALIELAREQRTAIMCSEAVPWRCHRRLVADALTIRGWTVIDIISGSRDSEHSLTPFAEVQGERLTYPAQ